VLVLGFDPGGRNGNAVAALRAEAGSVSIRMASVASGAEALDWFDYECRSVTPSGLGIDTFLHWSLSPGGWRPADRVLKQYYPSQSRSILSINSTFGSMVGQGVALAIAARIKRPELRLNEVHPKIVFRELWPSEEYVRKLAQHAVAKRVRLWESLTVACEGNLESEDQFDAAICCFATYKGLVRDWAFDLVKDLNVKSKNLVFPLSDVSYYWPKTLSQ
jgi:hypothetical protein